MIGTSIAILGGPNPLGLPSISSITTVNGLKDALTQLNGGAELLVPTNQAALLNRIQSSAIGSRLSVLRTHMIGGGALSQDGSGGPVLALGDGTTATDAPSDILVAQTGPTDMSMWKGRLGVFVNGLGQFGNTDSTGNQNGFSFNNEGIVLGADYLVTPRLALGAAFGYTRSNTDFDVTPQSPSGQFQRGNLFQGMLYANWFASDALYFDGVASFGGGGTDSQRHIYIPGFPGGGDRIATGSFATQTYSVNVGGGYMFPMGAFTVTPTAHFEYNHLGSDAFTESGANGLDLNYGASSQDAVLSLIGGQVQYAISTNFGVLSPTARFNWAHQYNGGATTIAVAYANDPTLLSNFTLPGNQVSHDYFDLGVGVALQLPGNWSGFVNYDSILGVTHTSFNSFTAGARFAF
jgi:outer membrane autotransporter protein